MIVEIYLDFEYKGTNEPTYDLVAYSWDIYNKQNLLDQRVEWLHNDFKNKAKLKRNLMKLRHENTTLFAFNVDAEARSLISLGLDPTKYNWIDLQQEWRLITNHCSKYRYGRQYINGNVRTTTRPSWRAEHGEADHSKPEGSLLACTYKMIGVEGDKEEKDRMRKLILRGHYNDKIKKDILEYCKGDTGELKKIWEAFKEAFAEDCLYGGSFDLDQYIKEAQYRGKVVAYTALMAARGYPVDKKKTLTFMNNVPSIIKDCQEDIARQFPDLELFKWDKKNERYALKEKGIREWIKTTPFKDQWPKTEQGQYSLALDSFEQFYHFRHEFPEGNLGAQMLRLKKMLQSLNGFRPKAINAKDKRTFKDFMDSKGRVHAYLNANGAQSGRWQMKALGFLFLKSAWMRSLCAPEKGKVIIGGDFASEEFLISAVLSQDSNMIESYRSGDVYLDFAKKAGAVPTDGTKAEYKAERDRFKSTVLGVSYGMGPTSLAHKLTQDTGTEHSKAQAKDLINMFFEVYADYKYWRDNLMEQYQEPGFFIKLPSGWTLFNENPNSKSTLNYPVQGHGAEVLKRCLINLTDQNYKCIMPLHDAMYIEERYEDRLDAVENFVRIMRESFIEVFDGLEGADLIRVDVKMWGPDLKNEYIDVNGIEVKCQDVYVDGRAKSEYDKFSKYFRAQE